MIKIPDTNIELQLQKTRDAKFNDASFLKTLRTSLSHLNIVHSSEETHPNSEVTLAKNQFDFDQLETSRIYHIEQIKKVCVDYRLRFLDLKYFKGELPLSANSAIEDLQNRHLTELDGLKIMAPSKLFKLKDKDDPLLFVPMGNHYYYLVHKWGNDLHPLRKLLVWPFKNMVNLVLFALLISYFVTLLVPSGLFSKTNSTAEFWIIYFFMFKWIAAVIIFYGFALGKNFNPAIWNSKYFNA